MPTLTFRPHNLSQLAKVKNLRKKSSLNLIFCYFFKSNVSRDEIHMSKLTQIISLAGQHTPQFALFFESEQQRKVPSSEMSTLLFIIKSRSLSSF